MSTVNRLAYAMLSSSFIYISSSYGMPGETEEEVVVRDFSSRDAYTYAPHPIDDKLIHDRETGAIYLLPHTPTDVQHTEAGGKVDMPGKASAIDSDPEAVLGQLFRDKDGREPVLFPAQNPLYRIHAQVNIMVAQGSYGGSGTLVGPHHLLTAGHNLYDQKYGGDGWARSISVRCATADCSNPFGEQRVIRAYTYRRWVDFLDKEFDLALFILDKPIGLNIGWSGLAYLPQMPKRHHELDGEFYVAGYPQTVKRTRFPDSETKKGEEFETMWRMSNRNEMGEIQRVRINPLTLSYPIDTSGGQSGSSLWYARGEAKAPEPYTVGVHAYGGAGTNSATRITKDRFTQIMQWIADTFEVKRLPTDPAEPVKKVDKALTQSESAERQLSEAIQRWKPATSCGPRVSGGMPPLLTRHFVECKAEGAEESHLVQLGNLLHPSGHSDLTTRNSRRVAITGMGGVGKSTLARRYYELAEEYNLYDAYFWITAETKEQLVQAYSRFLRSRGIKFNGSENEYIINALTDYFENKRYLLVLDNALSSANIEDCLPRGRGHVVVTTRIRGSNWEKLELRPFRKSESFYFILELTQKGYSEEEQEAASTLVQRLGHLPLALEQAGRYIANTPGAFKAYLEEYNTKARELLSYREETVTEGDQEDQEGTLARDIVYTTFEISGMVLDSMSRQLLTYFSYFCADDIPSFLFENLTVEGKRINLEKSLRKLELFSLLKRSKDPVYVSVHRLVQKVERLKEESKERNEILDLNKLVRLLIEGEYEKTFTFAETSLGTFTRLSRLTPHAIALAEHCKERGIQTHELLELYVRVASFLNRIHDFTNARALLENAQELAIGLNCNYLTMNWILRNLLNTYILSEDRLPSTLSLKGLDNLTIAEISVLVGDFDKAENCYIRYIREREYLVCKYGENYTYTLAMAYKGLGRLYLQAKKPELALEYYSEALAIYKPHHGDKSDDIASTWVCIGNALYCLQEWSEAIEYYERGLDMFSQLFPYPDENIEIALGKIGLGRALIKNNQVDSGNTMKLEGEKMWGALFASKKPLPGWLDIPHESYSDSARSGRASPTVLKDTKENVSFTVLEENPDKTPHPTNERYLLRALPISRKQAVEQIKANLRDPYIKKMIAGDIYRSFFRHSMLREMEDYSSYKDLFNEYRRIYESVTNQILRLHQELDICEKEPRKTGAELLSMDSEKKDGRFESLRVLTQKEEEIKERLWSQSLEGEMCKYYVSHYLANVGGWLSYIAENDMQNHDKSQYSILNAIAELNNLEISIWVKLKGSNHVILNRKVRPSNSSPKDRISLYHCSGLTEFKLLKPSIAP